eukprot:CAMPEP_0119563154 /NCGR_PEP_ID=MMETSP1352-20130426/22596_1 /TAXON_ID=265584 /ORGANISM="Stauroneis constricta, Strain CCMP1120" /LENGTH=231 /DNA_ID=CAMNT_0007611699 /DNA_START=124 /DNA_END=816 /DNA_ORIENTATION=-
MRTPSSSRLHVRIDGKHVDTEGDSDSNWWEVDDLEVLKGDGEDFEEEMEWIPDRDKARIEREMLKRSVAHPTAAKDILKPNASSSAAAKTKKEKTGKDKEEEKPKTRATPYTEEEEELIAAMGGKMPGNNKREPGYMGDCTLKEIAMDYSVPICYLVDVLCMWGVPVPIDVHARLGDLVTGEQAFAILEAVYSLDVGILHDRYSDDTLEYVCLYHQIDIKDAFQFAMKEGW